MTTPGDSSGVEYTDPGELINSCFSQSNAELRALVAKDKEREEAMTAEEAAEETKEWFALLAKAAEETEG